MLENSDAPQPIERVVERAAPNLPEGALFSDTPGLNILAFRAANLAEKLRIKAADSPSTSLPPGEPGKRMPTADATGYRPLR